MRQMTSKRIGSHRLYSFRRQKGVSLIPALITICIFTLLATQVVIPNQNRNIRETNINAVASSVEQLIQATYAYRAASASLGGTSWPASIGDLVPVFLPVFNNFTPWGGAWTIETAGGFHFKTDTKNPDTARALVQKIGSYARVGPANDKEVQIFPGMTAAPTIDDLTITNDITVRRNIILTGKIIASDGTTELFDATSHPTSPSPVTSADKTHYHSSEQFKQNIHPLDTPIENIYQLKPVSFDYKEAFKQYKTPNAANSEIGLIAEQVLPLIPEITLVDDDNKVMGIDYPKLSILLLSAMQALKAEVTALKTNNQQLQLQMDGLNVENEGLNIESEGLNIEGLNSANINNARTDNGTDE
jgi:hypothetical protein